MPVEKYRSYEDILGEERRERRAMPKEKLGYTPGHGARLRAGRRMFAREEAETSAESRMAELEKEQEFTRPLQTAKVGRLGALAGLRGAEAEKVRYGTEFERGARGTLEDILKSKAGLGKVAVKERELGLTEAEREIKLREEREAETEAEAARIEAEAARPPVPAEPGRRLRPSMKKALLSGRPEIGIRGPLAPVKEAYDIFKLLKEGLGKGYEYAYPRGK